MTRVFHEIRYQAPLSTPVEIDAYHAPADGDLRVIVFPGAPSNKSLFTRFLRTAPEGMEIFVITRPGYGRGHKEAVIDFDEQIKAIAPLMAGGEFGSNKKVVTMGISYGGELALQAALRYSAEVLGVVSVAALIEEPHYYALQLEAWSLAENFDPLLPSRYRKVRDEIVGRRDQIGPLLDQVRKMNKPIEILHGDFDAVVPLSNAAVLSDVVGERGNVEIIPGGTHYLELQHPRRLHAAIARVCERAARAEAA